MPHRRFVLTAVSALLGGIALLSLPFAGPAGAADDVATFGLTVEIGWSAETAPLEFPDGAHLSGLIGATHNSRYVLFRDGHTASSGLELVAENGRPTVLEAELAEAARRGRVGSVIEGPNLASVPGTIETRFTATKTHTRLSFVTMLAPSPDWFTGIADFPLLADGAWIDGADLTLWVWDSGTDDGQTYAAPNMDTQPRQSIRLLSGPHFLSENGLVTVGTARLRRIGQ